jgi:glycosyltransferase involved in cell wall biosynthesis
MKILMVLSDNPFPPDIRVEKEAKTLLKSGHEIHLVAVTYGNEKDEEDVNGIKVHRYGFPRISVIWANYEYIRLLSTLKAFKVARKHGCQTIHIHDLPMALPSLLLGKLLGKKVVVDFHENYPELFYYEFKKRWMGKKSIRNFPSHIIVVVEEERDRYRAAGIPEERITILSNSVDMERMKGLNLGPSERQPDGRFVISYVGGFALHRGLDTLVKAVHEARKKVPNLHLNLVGDGAAKESLVELTGKLGMESSVTFTGQVPFENAMKYVVESDICVIPYARSPETEASFPHKLAQYMYLGRPIIVSDVRSLKRIVEENKCGLVFESGNHSDLALKIIELHEDPETRKRMAKNGENAALERYNWDAEGGKLIRLYQTIGRDAG